MSSKSVYCMFCHRPVQKGEHTIKVPRHITAEELSIWESVAGLREGQEFSEFHRFHTSHFESKYLSPTAPTQPRLLPGAIPTIGAVYRGECHSDNVCL